MSQDMKQKVVRKETPREAEGRGGISGLSD